ncbi:RNA-directed DNA polymerase, partial [Bacillus licheniformis]
FLQGKIKREENRIGKKNIFKTDIQNFYPSLYTHSIPWILVGKSVAKRNKKNYKEYYNQLDSLIQRCQRGETHGLPTGSFAFRLIAEIYMCKLDIKMEKHPYIRYVDDFELPFNDESEKSEFYKELNKELSILNLKIKIEKNQVDTFPFEGDNNSAFFFDYFLNFSDENLKNQSQRIYNFIDSCIYKEREGYKG